MGKSNGIRNIGMNIKFMFTGYRMHNFLSFLRTKVLKYVLIALLALTVIFILLHPVNKIKVLYFLTRSCTLETEAISVKGEYGYIGGPESVSEIRIDGNWMENSGSYYQFKNEEIVRYYRDMYGNWQWEKEDINSSKDLSLGTELLKRSNWKRAKGRLFVWELDKEIAHQIDDLSNITMTINKGKIAIVGEYTYRGYVVKVAIRFTKFGRTKIDFPW